MMIGKIVLPDKGKWLKELKHLMKVNGITQIDLAEEMGITPMSISYTFNGKRGLTYEKLEQLQDSVHEIINRAKSGSNNNEK